MAKQKSLLKHVTGVMKPTVDQIQINRRDLERTFKDEENKLSLSQVSTKLEFAV
jgi:hypothetical protein